MNKDLGQYFTTHADLSEYVISKILNAPDRILEPSVGRGHLVDKYLKMYPACKTRFDMYEIDETIPVLESISKKVIHYGDFLMAKIDHAYDTIIGNPPFVKSKGGNLYIKFIEKCVDILDESGELIFIVPSEFMRSTRASRVISRMSAIGSFTDFYFPHDETMFEGASVDVMVFRYQKGLVNNRARVRICHETTEYYVLITSGIITFHSVEPKNCVHTNSLFDVFVGMVTGCDRVFKHESGNIDVLTKQGRVEKFIMIDSFPSNNEQIDNHLMEHKQDLIKRKIRSFDETNWFQWGALRNLSTIEKYYHTPCIYVSTITRSDRVAFRGTVQYFGGSLLMLIPKQNDSVIDLDRVVDFLNSLEFRQNYIFANRFIITHRQLSHAIITSF